MIRSSPCLTLSIVSLRCLSTVVRQRFTASSQHLRSFFTKSCSLLAASSQPLRSLFAAPCQPSGVLLSLAKNYCGAECQPPLINHRLWVASFASFRSSWLSAISHCIFNEESLQWSIFMQFIRKHTEHFRALSFEASSSQFSLCCRLTQWSADAWWSPAFEKVLKSFEKFWRNAFLENCSHKRGIRSLPYIGYSIFEISASNWSQD